MWNSSPLFAVFLYLSLTFYYYVQFIWELYFSYSCACIHIYKSTQSNNIRLFALIYHYIKQLFLLSIPFVVSLTKIMFSFEYGQNETTINYVYYHFKRVREIILPFVCACLRYFSFFFYYYNALIPGLEIASFGDCIGYNSYRYWPVWNFLNYDLFDGILDFSFWPNLMPRQIFIRL